MLSSALLVCAALAFGAEPRIEAVLWQPPGPVEQLDLAAGPGGRSAVPAPPFRFVEVDPNGTTPKALVRDARGRLWDVKWGPEAKPEVFAARFVWAAGYYAEPTFFVPRGLIRGAKRTGRIHQYINKNGYFKNARFQLRDPAYRFRNDLSWTWKKNPFAGTHELNGLRVLVMLLSNWDNKDGRDTSTNAGILEDKRRPRWIYFVDDWGASMGAWGGFFTREKWDCKEFRKQTSDFVKAVDGREVEFGFKGKHAGEFKDDITTEDVRWLLARVGRISDAQIRAALRASGATPHELRCYTTALRSRIEQLRRAANGKAPAVREARR